MKHKIINLLAELLADQTERTVLINEIQEDRLGADKPLLHRNGFPNTDKPTMGTDVGGVKC